MGNEHTGKVDFFYDDIVNQSKNDQINVKVQPKYDIASLLYCLIALNSYVKGKYTYTWKDSPRSAMVQNRIKYIMKI